MDRFLMIWPKSTDVIHINYHYTQFAEVIDYLDKRVDRKIEVIDEDIHNLNIIDFIRKNEVRKVVMQVNYENAMNAFKLADEIRLNFKNMPMLAYGSVPFLHPNLFLNSNFNAIYSNGDFEVAIETFLNNYSECDEADYKELKGISVIIENKLHKTNPGEFISNDEWGMSNKTRVPIMEYDNIKGKNRFVLNISRGCPFGCEHCLIQMVEGKQERRRSIDNIKQTLENITKDYKHIKIWAANFTLNKKYVEDFCNMMIESFRDITWECATRIDLVQDQDLLKLMRKAGCKQISIGVESLNNSKLIGTKNFSEMEIAKAIYNIQNAGILSKCCIMLGMQGQTKEDIITTFDFLSARNAIIRPTIYTPYQVIDGNTKINELCKYNRKTYDKSNIPGIEYEQLLQLVKSPSKYRKILNIDKEKETEFER